MTGIRRGDIALALFPDSNLQTLKRRPVLLIQRDDLTSGLAQVIVAMISGNMARAGHPSRVVVRLGDSQSRSTGLAADSVIVTDNLATIVVGEIDRTIGRMSTMESVDSALRHTLALP